MTSRTTKGNVKVTTSRVTFLELLQLTFIAFKLLHVINWSWWLVLSPTLIPLFLALIAMLVGFVLILVSKGDKDGK